MTRVLHMWYIGYTWESYRRKETTALYSKCGLWTRKETALGALRNTESQASPQIHWILFCILTRSPGNLHACSSLKSTGLGLYNSWQVSCQNDEIKIEIEIELSAYDRLRPARKQEGEQLNCLWRSPGSPHFCPLPKRFSLTTHT